MQCSQSWDPYWTFLWGSVWENDYEHRISDACKHHWLPRLWTSLSKTHKMSQSLNAAFTILNKDGSLSGSRWKSSTSLTSGSSSKPRWTRCLPSERFSRWRRHHKAYWITACIAEPRTVLTKQYCYIGHKSNDIRNSLSPLCSRSIRCKYLSTSFSISASSSDRIDISEFLEHLSRRHGAKDYHSATFHSDWKK